MKASYKKLWKILIDKDMKKKRFAGTGRNQLDICDQVVKGRECWNGSAYENMHGT